MGCAQVTFFLALSIYLSIFSIYLFLVKGFTRKGACHFTMKEFSKAKEAYTKALEIDNENKVRLFTNPEA